MQSSSADTNFTFGDNVVAVAESGNQSSPATGDSGDASGTTWNNIPSRRSKSSASNRSVGPQEKYSGEWTTNAKKIYRTKVNPGPISEDQGNSGEKENRQP